MIGRLPKTLTVNDVEYDIRTDYRDVLLIIQAFQDTELSYQEQLYVMLEILYVDYESIPQADIEEAVEQAMWFLNCGDKVGNAENGKPIYDFEYDEQIMFSALNKVANKEIREVEYIHYWTFLGYFNEIGDGVFATVLSIRQKKKHGKKLEKWEQEYYSKNRDLIDLPRKLTKEEQEDMELLKDFL